MKLNFGGVSKENLLSGIDLNIDDSQREQHLSAIFNKTASDMLDFLDLPNMSKESIQDIVDCGNEIRENFDTFVVLGIGGSALGVKFLKDAFVDNIYKNVKTKVYVCDNIDSDSFISLLNNLNLKSTCFNVITKSGTTSETLVQMMIVVNRYNEIDEDFSKHLVITTTEGNKLYNFAQQNSVKTFTIPKGVGGRFSVLSAVGLLPAAVMGINVSKLLDGAKESRVNAELKSIENLPYTCAYIAHKLLKNGFTNLVVMPYSERLKLFPEFFAQLWAESLGKKMNRNCEVVFEGQTPIKAVGVTDQHSQLQLYSEGRIDKLIMFVTVNNSDIDEQVIDDLGLGKHLKSISLKELMDFEYQSTAFALTKNNRPNITLMLDRIDEKNVGELIFMAELMTAFMGELLNIDAFNQLGVELSKIYTKACLNYEGLEEEKKEIQEYYQKLKKYTIK